jgi:hypothetical protein
VLCVTGDARAYNVRPDVTQVFDLDGPRLAALAVSTGMPTAVPETPAAPPRHLRPFRLAQKQRAGAAVAVLNHDTVASVVGFMAGHRAGRGHDPGYRRGGHLHRSRLGLGAVGAAGWSWIRPWCVRYWKILTRSQRHRGGGPAGRGPAGHHGRGRGEHLRTSLGPWA